MSISRDSIDTCYAAAYNSRMRKRCLDQLVQDQPVPLIWAITAQPFMPRGWKELKRFVDGSLYGGEDGRPMVMFRGLVDAKGRRWMTLSATFGAEAMPPDMPRLVWQPQFSVEALIEIRREFFPKNAIVAMAVNDGLDAVAEMWWGVDEEALPLDPDWKWAVSAPGEAG